MKSKFDLMNWKTDYNSKAMNNLWSGRISLAPYRILWVMNVTFLVSACDMHFSIDTVRSVHTGSYLSWLQRKRKKNDWMNLYKIKYVNVKWFCSVLNGEFYVSFQCTVWRGSNMATVGPRLVNKQFNSPINLYSPQAIQETLDRQAQVLSNGAVG